MKYQICFSATDTVKRYLRLKSKKTGYSVSSIINAILQEYIDQEQKKQDETNHHPTQPR